MPGFLINLLPNAMKNTIAVRFILLILFCFSHGVLSSPETIKQAIAKAMPGSEIDTIAPSPVAGIYEVVIGPTLFYVSEDGRYLFNGSMYDLEASPAERDLTEPKIATARTNAIAKVGVDNMIVFKSPNQKQVVSVFTDVDCGYCRKLHSEIDQYLGEGITIQYLFYPRAGLNSDAYKKAVAVWCSDDKHLSLTKVKRGESIEMKTCKHPIDSHVQLATTLGIRGTPMIVTEAGEVLPGYVPAKELSSGLRSSKSPK